MKMIKDIKTNSGLLEALRQATKRKQTPAELNAQRVSFIYGSIDKNSGVTHTRIKEVLAEHEGSNL